LQRNALVDQVGSIFAGKTKRTGENEQVTATPSDSIYPSSRAEEFALLVDSVGDYAIFLLSPDGRIHSWNLGAARITGYEAPEVLGQHFSLFYGPEDLAAHKPANELQTAIREGSVEDEGWRIRKDGSTFWANTVITVLRDDEGAVRGFAIVTRDMTRRRAAEEQLRQGAEVFQLLVSSVRDYAIFMLDPDGFITTWNSGAEAIKGYKPEEIIGRHMSAFYSEEDNRSRKPQRELAIARERGSVEDEGWRLRKDGTRFWANVVITAVYNSHGELRGFAKVTRDISDRRMAEEAQRALLEQREARLSAEEERSRAEASYRVAQEANRAKDEFLMTLSHELRTPMTAILGWARMLPLMKPDDAMFREAAQSIAAAAELQARLIDDILDVSRIVSGKLRLTPELVEVSRVILNAVDAVSPTAEAKHITLTTAVSPSLGPMVVDATRIQQVVWNLLSNAVKFTPRGGRVVVSSLRSGSQIQIAVTDTGEGIDPHFLPHVFEPFRQAESAHTRSHGGLGLGLSIVRYIAEAHGGTITAQSEGRGKGSTFTVTLPVQVVSAYPEAVTSAMEGDTFKHGGRLRDVDVVLVDDDSKSRKLVMAVLQAAGANVVAHESAESALEGIERSRPHLVITDIAMPEVDGYAFIRELRARDYGREIRVVALSAFPAAMGEQGAFDAYLSKPIDPFRLIDEIARITATPST
jgi:PAS domain S-box-containing protein